MPYRVRVGPAAGPVRYATTPKVVAVFGNPDEPRPVGAALCVGVTTAGVALWQFSVGGYDVPGRFVIVDREFRPAR